ncbi:MAG: hypothetical protein AAFP90_15515, partial [Planctomycetota bacterium]
MTFLGKIFAITVLILSTVFLALSLVTLASHRNWQQVVMDPNEGLRQEVTKVMAINAQLTTARAEAERQLALERATRTTALATVQTQATKLEQSLTEAEGRIRDLNNKNNQLVLSEKTATDELVRLTNTNNELRTKIREEQNSRDELFAKALKLTDENNQLGGRVLQQEERNKQLLAEVTRFKEVVDAAGINVNDPVDNAPPKVNGLVTLVN